MAPFAGLSPEYVLERLRSRDVERELPLAMGGPGGPTLCVGLLDGEWCLYHMAMDEAGWDAFADERQASGEPLFPEHRMRFLVPGEVVLRRPNRAEFADAFAALEITFDRNYRAKIKPRDGDGERGWPWSWFKGS